MPKVPEGKQVFMVYIDKELFDKFKRIAFTKFSKLRGSLSDAAVEAIKMWVENEENRLSHTHIHGGDRAKSRTMKTLQKIASTIASEYPNEVPQSTVEKLIVEIAGEKVVPKYMSLLMEYGYLTPHRRVANSDQYIFRVGAGNA